jgi:hypothetical protein
MTFAAIGNTGSNNWYSWNGTRSIALTNGASFGPNGTIRMVAPLSKLWGVNNAATAESYLNNGYSGKQPDIVLYNGYDGPVSVGLSTALANYVRKGGCLVYYALDGNVVNTNIVVNGIFGSNYSATAIGNGNPSNNDDQLYLINNDMNDPIINGPFGNAAGYYWGEDNAHANTMILNALPPNSVQVCSASNSNHTNLLPTSSVVWYSKSSNLFFFGDTVGAAIAGTGDGNDTTGWPSLYSTTGIPMPKRYGFANTSLNQWCYNSILEMNAIAFYIRQAAVSGINPH